MSKIYPLLNSLFEINGADPILWDKLKNIIQNLSDEIVPFCFLIKNRINSGNKQEILLALIILDFAVDSGRLLLWTNIDNMDFLSCIINILKINNDYDIQNFALYLIQKWSYKFQNYPSIQNCKNVFYSLKDNNILFPSKIKISYKTYLSQNNKINNIQNNFKNNNNNIKNNNLNMNNKININNININFKSNYQKNNDIIKKSRIPSNPNDYIQNINLDLNPNNYEKKYKILVFKLYDWTHLIQEINIIINKNRNGHFNSKLNQLYNDLKNAKEQLVKEIQGPKLKNEKLMEISLNVCEDIIMTLNRVEKSLKGEDPGPFLSSFSRDNNPNLNKYDDKHKIFNDDFNFQGPEERIKKLGFGDTIKTNYLDSDGNNNINNSLSELFTKENKTIKLDRDKISDIYLKNDSQFFMNISNSDFYLNDKNTNRYPDFDLFLEKNKSNFLNNSDKNFNKNELGNMNINDFKDNHKNSLINNAAPARIADNNDIKRLIAYERNKNDKYFYHSQKFPNSYHNLNNEENDKKIYKSEFIKNGNDNNGILYI